MEMLEFLEGWSGITCFIGTLLHAIKDICTKATAIMSVLRPIHTKA